MTKIKGFSYWKKIKGKRRKIKVKSHNRRTYKGYRHKGSNPSRSYKQDRARKAKYRPRKKYKKGLGNQGDW